MNFTPKTCIFLAPLFLAFSFVAHSGEEFETRLDAGYSLTDGNSNTTLITFGVDSRQEKEEREIILTGSYTYGQNKVTRADGSREDETTQDRARGSAQINWLHSSRAYSFVNLTGLKDEIASIDYRLIAGPGAGYFFRRDDTMRLSAELGAVYVTEKTSSDEEDYLGARLAQTFRYHFHNATLRQSLEVVMEADDSENYLLKAEIALESSLTERLSLRVVLQNDYDNTPDSDSKRNDLALVSGLSLTL